MAGFTWKYNLGGGRPLIHTMVNDATETLTQGDYLSLVSGETKLFTTNDALMLGTFQGTHDPGDMVSGLMGTASIVSSTTRLKVIVNPDAVYEGADANDRAYGVSLDLGGSTGAMAIATSSNADIQVVEDKRQASDPTRFIAKPGEHVYHP